MDLMVFWMWSMGIGASSFETLAIKNEDDGIFAGMDPTYLADVFFSILDGRRYRNGCTLFKYGKFGLTVIALTTECTRRFTTWYFALAVESDNDFQLPPMLDLWNMEYSPFIAVAQYISSFLAGENARLVLIWRCAGAVSA